MMDHGFQRAQKESGVRCGGIQSQKMGMQVHRGTRVLGMKE